MDNINLFKSIRYTISYGLDVYFSRPLIKSMRQLTGDNAILNVIAYIPISIIHIPLKLLCFIITPSYFIAYLKILSTYIYNRSFKNKDEVYVILTEYLQYMLPEIMVNVGVISKEDIESLFVNIYDSETTTLDDNPEGFTKDTPLALAIDYENKTVHVFVNVEIILENYDIMTLFDTLSCTAIAASKQSLSNSIREIKESGIINIDEDTIMNMRISDCLDHDIVSYIKDLHDVLVSYRKNK